MVFGSTLKSILLDYLFDVVNGVYINLQTQPWCHTIISKDYYAYKNNKGKKTLNIIEVTNGHNINVPRPLNKSTYIFQPKAKMTRLKSTSDVQ